MFKIILRQEIKKIIFEPQIIKSMLLLPIITILMSSFLTLDNNGIQNQTVYIARNEARAMFKSMPEAVYLSEDELTEEFIKSDKLKSQDVLISVADSKMNIYYNETNQLSKAFAEAVRELEISEELDKYAELNNANASDYLKITDENNGNSLVGNMLSIVFPFVLVLSLFQESSSFAINAIAGEREKGVLDKLLLTPVSKLSIITGKTIAAAVCGVISSIVYFGMVFIFSFIPRFDVFGIRNVHIDMGNMALIGLCVLLLSMTYASISAATSYASHSLSSAKSYKLPVLGVTIVLAMSSMLRIGRATARSYSIPIYNVCLIIQDIVNGIANAENMIITVASLFMLSVISALVMCLSVKDREE